MSDIDDLKEVSQQAFKIGMVSNGTALTLSLAVYARLGGADVVVSKFPIWCFFIGLIFGGLIIVLKISLLMFEISRDLFERATKHEKEMVGIIAEIEGIKNSTQLNANQVEQVNVSTGLVDETGEKSRIESSIENALTSARSNLIEIRNTVGELKKDYKLRYNSELMDGHRIKYAFILKSIIEFALIAQYLLFVLGAAVAIWFL